MTLFLQGVAPKMELTGVMSVIGEEVSKRMACNDPSHDFAHVLRVRRLALRIAMEEKIGRKWIWR